MRLLFVIDNLGSGGAQRQMVTLARGLKARGHQVEFFVYYPHDHYRPLLDAAAIEVHLHPKTSRFSLVPIIALRHLVAHGGFDLVLAFLDTPNFYAELASIGVGKTKVVVSERFMYPPGALPLKLRLLQQGHRLAHAITVNSHHQRQRMVQEFPWMREKVQTIYNGVDLERFGARAHTEGTTPGGALSLVSIGTVVPKKNMVNLALALTICRDRYNIKPVVRWVGKQDSSAAGRRIFAEVSGIVHKNRLDEQWEWLGERNDIPDLLRRHDALVHPSFYEGLPNVICEALACGLPVLASNVCDHPWLVEQGVRGFLFDPRSPESIAEAIRTLDRCSGEQRRSMAAAARRFAETNLSASLFTDNYEKLFHALVHNSGVGQD